MTLAAWTQNSWQSLRHWANQFVTHTRGSARLISARTECLHSAIMRSKVLAAYRILHDFEELNLRDVIHDLVEVLCQCLLVMLTTTGGGALIGGIAGGVFGVGVGAIPGAAVGATAGAQMGEWILVAMGLKVLSEYIVRDMPDIARAYMAGIHQAWFAATPPLLPQQSPGIDSFAIQHAAEKIARAHVKLLILLLMGLVAYLARGRGTMAELVANVRNSKLGAGFADWMVRNEGKLKAEPRLQPIANRTTTNDSVNVSWKSSARRNTTTARDDIESSASPRASPRRTSSGSDTKAPRAAHQLTEPEAFHVTTNTRATQGVLDGIDPAFLNPNSRFGAAFYLAEQPETALSELASHGANPSMTIRFSMNSDAANVLDLTDPDIANAWGYTGGPITPQTQAIGSNASNQGYNVIRFYSERSPGEVNYAILDDFNEILTPTAVSPAKP